MVTEVYGHIIDEDRRKNAEMMENAFYNKENLNPQMKGSGAGWSGCRVVDESVGKSGDGCATYIIGKDNEGIIRKKDDIV